MTGDLYAYTLRANKFGDRKSARRLDQLRGDGKGGDVLDTFDRAMRHGTEWPPAPPPGVIDDRKTIYTIQQPVTPADDTRVRYGHIEVAVRTVAQNIARQRHNDEVEVDQDDRGRRPVFYWLAVPKQGHAALLLTERSGRFGIATTFWREFLIGELRADHPVSQSEEDVTFSLDPYVPNEAWELYELEGVGLEGAELVKVLYETDEDKEQEEGTKRRRVGKLTTKIDRSVVPAKDRVVNAFRNKDMAAAVEIVSGGYLSGDLEYDTVVVHANFNGKVRPVRIQRGKMSQLGHPLDPNVVQTDSRGFPTIDSMATFAAMTAKDVGSALGF